MAKVFLLWRTGKRQSRFRHCRGNGVMRPGLEQGRSWTPLLGRHHVWSAPRGGGQWG